MMQTRYNGQTVQWLIDAGADINSKHKNGVLAIKLAASCKFVQTEHCISPVQYGSTRDRKDHPGGLDPQRISGDWVNVDAMLHELGLRKSEIRGIDGNANAGKPHKSFVGYDRFRALQVEFFDYLAYI